MSTKSPYNGVASQKIVTAFPQYSPYKTEASLPGNFPGRTGAALVTNGWAPLVEST
jgi:hypothetical protein